MTKQAKILLLLFFTGSFLFTLSCTGKKGEAASENTQEPTLDSNDRTALNGNLKTLNVRVVRKVREDEEIKLPDCTANNDSCYVDSGSGSLVHIDFCLDNSVGSPVSSVNVDFLINDTIPLTKHLTDQGVGKSSKRYSTGSVDYSGPVSSLTVKINTQDTVPIPHCTDGG